MVDNYIKISGHKYGRADRIGYSSNQPCNDTTLGWCFIYNNLQTLADACNNDYNCGGFIQWDPSYNQGYLMMEHTSPAYDVTNSPYVSIYNDTDTIHTAYIKIGKPYMDNLNGPNCAGDKYSFENGKCVGNIASNCNGVICTAPLHATPYCSGLACGFSCDQGYSLGSSGQCLIKDPTDCDGITCVAPENGVATCTSNYTCDFDCNSGFTRKGNSCMGTTASNCNGIICSVPPHSDALCSSDTYDCGFQCKQNTTKINGLCVPETDCQTLQCVAPPNGFAFCNSNTIQCDFDCNDGYYKSDTGLCLYDFDRQKRMIAVVTGSSLSAVIIPFLTILGVLYVRMKTAHPSKTFGQPSSTVSG